MELTTIASPPSVPVAPAGDNISTLPGPGHRAESMVESIAQSKSNLDDDILRAQGHEASMPRVFSVLSSVGLAFSITNSWIGYLSNFSQNLVYGGPQSVVFGLIVACVIQWVITLGLSELASAFPSSGGQYHFVYLIAPEKHKRFAAFLVGWLSILAWWIVTSSGISLAAASIVGMASFWDNSWAPQQWQVYIVYVALIVFTMLPLVLTPRRMPRIVQFTLFATILGFVITFVVLVATKDYTRAGSSITTPGQGTSGWDHNTAWLLGVVNAMYAFGATDAAIHIAEEMKEPGKRLPQIMNLTMLIGLITTLPLVMVMMFGLRDLAAVNAATLDSAEVFYQITQSKTTTSVLMSWLIMCYVSAIPSQWVTSGRIAWAFARDNGVPYSKYFVHIDEKRGFPLRATVAAAIFTVFYGLLYLASTSAFNSIVTSAVLFLNLTYAVPQAILLFQGREKSLPPRHLNLGKFGYFCNAFSTGWIVVLGALVCFPPTLPITLGDMNYTSIIIVGLFGVVLGFWYTIGRNFEGPTFNWQELNAANLASAQEAHIRRV
ncbi:hypothetical protein BP6252_00329 [Coleophoma cylindrospora]|uniref:Choline transport protein n=1 Tax=Coleophoma cylindrospora TaxID=1849047 RepID=A0A3D8SPS4_9HELO|nr:hypothetical protein BP6252_00329 [Coleophoma cylindrospora]